MLLRFAGKEEIVLKIQKEMVDNSQPLEQTNASRVVNAELDQATGLLESLRIKSNQMEEYLTQRKLDRRVQDQQDMKHQKSVQEIKKKYTEEAKERERQILEAKAKEQHKAEDHLRRQKKESRKTVEERPVAEKAHAVREAERRKAERKREEESLRQLTSEQFRRIFASQSRTLFTARCNNRLKIGCDRNKDQHAGYLRWCSVSDSTSEIRRRCGDVQMTKTF